LFYFDTEIINSVAINLLNNNQKSLNVFFQYMELPNKFQFQEFFHNYSLKTTTFGKRTLHCYFDKLRMSKIGFECLV